jgi:acetolactate synthase regulatory subunit
MPTVRLTLRLHPESDAVHRVISVCRRRRLQVIALDYAGDEMTITLTGEAGRTQRIGCWLDGLIDVLEVGHSEPVASHSNACG